MSRALGFKATLCFKGEAAAKGQAENTHGIVIFWEGKKRRIAVCLSDGIAIFPYDSKHEVMTAHETLILFGHPAAY